MLALIHVHQGSYVRQVTHGFEQPQVRAPSSRMEKLARRYVWWSTQFCNCLRETIHYNLFSSNTLCLDSPWTLGRRTLIQECVVQTKSKASQRT